jgi:hypothetical protein
VAVDQARENSTRKWIKLARISPLQVDHAGESRWIMLVRNDNPKSGTVEHSIRNRAVVDSIPTCGSCASPAL